MIVGGTNFLGGNSRDNAIAMELFRQKFLVVNPALTLRTFHMHESAVRTYDPKDIVDKPAYLYIAPTGLNDLKPTTTFGCRFSRQIRRARRSRSSVLAPTWPVAATPSTSTPAAPPPGRAGRRCGATDRDRRRRSGSRPPD